MEKVKITYENMLAGLLLRFGKINKADIEVIQADLFNKYGISMSKFAIDYCGIARYIMTMGDNYYPVVSDEVKSILEEKQGNDMKTYLDMLSVEDMVILKLNLLGSVPDYLIGTVFSDEQEKVLDKLVDDLKVVYVWNNDIPHEDYQEIQLTSFGQARAFELEYFEQIEEFKQLLTKSGYDVSLLTDFLRTQNFNKGVYEILNIDNFLYYCSVYDRAARVEESSGNKLNKKN